MKNGVIPAIFRIDIEPNEHLQPEAGDDMQEWSGFVDTVEMVETLRGPLADIAGAAFNPNWFVRFDPEIERRYGRADAAFFLHREQFDKLAARQDPIGIHVHLHRWDCEKNVTFSDYGSSAWANYCLEFSSDVYAKCFDQPVRRTSQGGYFISEDIINTLVKLGIEADISLEPGLPAKMSDISIGEYASAPSTDFKAYQRTPYFPSTSNMAVPCKSELDKPNVRTYISLESVRFADRHIKNVDKKIDTGFFGGNKEHGMCWYDHGSNSSLIQVGNDDDFFITRSNSDYLYNNALYTKWTSRHPVRPQL